MTPLRFTAVFLALLAVGLELFALGHFANPLKTVGAQSTASLKLAIVQPIEVRGIPTPEQMMYVREGNPFTVPQGKLFVVTGVGSDNLTVQINVSFNGEVILTTRPYDDDSSLSVMTGGGPSVPEIPPGLVAPTGTIVEAVDPDPARRGLLLGYLVDA